MFLLGLVIGLIIFGWSIGNFSLPERYCEDQINKESLMAHGDFDECSSLMKKIMYIGWAFGVVVGIPLQLLFVSVLKAYSEELNVALEKKDLADEEYAIDWEKDEH